MNFADAISEYLFYGAKTKIRYAISRQGIKHNAYSEDKRNFMKWRVFEYAGGASKILSKKGKWISCISNTQNSFDNCPDYAFDSIEEAFSMLESIVSEDLRP